MREPCQANIKGISTKKQARLNVIWSKARYTGSRIEIGAVKLLNVEQETKDV